MPLFEYKPVDQQYYERYLKDFLPGSIIDVHTHVYSGSLRTDAEGAKPLPGRSQRWPSLVAADNPAEDLRETYRILFPDKQVTPVIFGMPSYEYTVENSNAYIMETARENGWPSLMLVYPEQTADTLNVLLDRGGFRGVKVYLEYAPRYIPAHEVRIFDFIPHHQLEALNAREAVLMLHIPRPSRLKDPVNVAQMLEIDRRYPKVKLIIAHIGRAYATEDVGDTLERLKDSRMLFDFSANTNHQVFEEALKTVGPRRLLFGSDLPITRMRMKRTVEHGAYINIIPKGLYGDVTGEAHMRETEGEEAAALSFFLYEEINAMRRACEAVSASRGDINALFYDNAAGIFL